jgi:transcriptional regulator with XRE-family HTH domain
MARRTPDPTDKHVGSRVRMRRIMLGMSQTALGDGLGITFQQVQKYEMGTNRVSASRMQQIANIFRVAPAFFFEGLPDQPQSQGRGAWPDYIAEMLATKDGLTLVKAFTQIKSAKLKRAIIHLVDEIGTGP